MAYSWHRDSIDEDEIEAVYITGDINDFYVQGNNADPYLTCLYSCHPEDGKGIEEFKLNKRDLKNVNIFRLWDGKTLYDTRDDIFSDVFPLKMYHGHINHYYNDTFEGYKATMAPLEQSSTEIYSEIGLNSNYNKELSLLGRPLQGKENDTCEICAIIAATIQINGKLKYPLEANLKKWWVFYFHDI